MFAAQEGMLSVCNILIASGGDVCAVNSQGRSALHTAAAFGHMQVCECLIDAGANKNELDLDSETPLDWAISCG